ncbi:MAG: hypothetical protein O3B04_09225 [Chloroflexi bacterium]|nr:hypothetical protein [Chloroflexota bacterium]
MKIIYKGKQVEAHQVFPVTENEPWNEYQLENGTRVRMKTVAQRILKIEGMDEYLIHSSNIMAVDLPEPEPPADK